MRFWDKKEKREGIWGFSSWVQFSYGLGDPSLGISLTELIVL
jgi:hypothetical protein